MMRSKKGIWGFSFFAVPSPHPREEGRWFGEEQQSWLPASYCVHRVWGWGQVAAQYSSPHLEKSSVLSGSATGKTCGSSLPHPSLLFVSLSPRGPVLEGLFITSMTSLTSGLTGSEELLSGCRAREEKLGGHDRPFLEKTQPPIHQLLPPLGSG